MSQFDQQWFAQLLAHAAAISDGSILRAAERAGYEGRVLILRNLQEQVFGQLDADRVRWEARIQLLPKPDLLEAFELFLHALRQLDYGAEPAGRSIWKSLYPARQDVRAPDTWARLADCANDLLRCARAPGATDWAPDQTGAG